MSPQEKMIDAEQEQRVLIVPAGGDQEQNANDEIMAPLSACAYSPLYPVNVEQLKQVAAARDNETTVVTPIGARISLGYTDENGETIIDDTCAVPKFGTLLLPSQIPLMVDEQPGLEHDNMKEYDFGRLPTYTDYCESVEGQEKPVEQVLAISAHEFLDLMLRLPEEFGKPNELSELVYSTLHFVRRGWCEKDTRFIQFLPYIVFYKKVAGKYQIFTYQRGKGVGEERLALGCSIGVGGHINPYDFLSMQSKYVLERQLGGAFLQSRFTGRILVDGFWTGILNNVFREGWEEILIGRRVEGTQQEFERRELMDIVYEAAQKEMVTPEQWLHRRTAFFLDYAAGEVEKVHLGMFMAIEVPEDYEIQTNEKELIDVGFKDLEELYLDNDQQTLPTRLECWSRSIVESLYETIEFVLEPTSRVVSSRFMADALSAEADHYMTAETIAKIPHSSRWKIGTLSQIFDPQLKFYAMNAFVRA